MAKAHAHVPVRPRHHAGRQHVRRPDAGRLRQEVRAAVRAAAGGGREVPGLARQPRSAREQCRYKPYNMNGQRYYTYARNNVRFFALDSTLMDPKQVAWIETSLQERARGMEDLLLPSSAVLERQPPRIVGRPARAARADLHQARRQRGVFGPRPRLRAGQAAEGHLLLRVGRGRPAAKRQHETDPSRPPRRSTRTGASCSWRSPGGDVLSDDLANRQDGRFRRDPAAVQQTDRLDDGDGAAHASRGLAASVRATRAAPVAVRGRASAAAAAGRG